MSTFRIYADESGTHGNEWLIIGMLFVPDHGALHAALCKAKEEAGYFNRSPKKSARYKEIHLSGFKSRYDVDVGKKWIDLFVAQSCYYRCVVIDWSLWEPKYFGDPFEPEALKKRRAYKKWAEMLIQPELKLTDGTSRFHNATFYLDKLRMLYGYDALDHLRERFTAHYRGSSPFIERFQHTDSWKDANQCLQLCDLLTGCLYQSLVPAGSPEKMAMRTHLDETLQRLGIQKNAPSFWRQYAQNTLTKHFPKFSAWFWRPTSKTKGGGRR
ncbi:MAG: DUF3800 domain-containing protein [Pirellulales bacterium]|nr:DUF3800 domain-containing protein [Pirellulales bacterium]